MQLDRDRPKVYREVLLKGIKVPYYVCSSCTKDELPQVKEEYSHLKYIGSSFTYYINGKRHDDEKLHYFFAEKVVKDLHAGQSTTIITNKKGQKFKSFIGNG